MTNDFDVIIVGARCSGAPAPAADTTVAAPAPAEAGATR